MLECIIPLSRSGAVIYSTIPNGYALAVSLKGNIRRLRRAAELTQAKLGDAIGVGQGAVSKWEKGTAEPAASDLPRIAVACRTTLDVLLKGVSADYDGRSYPVTGVRDVPEEHGSHAEARLVEQNRALLEKVRAYEAALEAIEGIAHQRQVDPKNRTTDGRQAKRRQRG